MLSAIAPRTSTLCSRRTWVTRIVRSTTPSATAPNGRFSQKIHRHEAESVSVPPSNGPAIAAIAHIAPMSPW